MRVLAYYSWRSPSPRRLGGDWEFGDHPAELVDDPTQVVSGCGHHDRVSKNQPVEST